MNLKINLKAFLKIILYSLLTWALIVFIIFLFSGTLKSALPVGILVMIGTIKYFYPYFKKYKKELMKDEINKIKGAVRTITILYNEPSRYFVQHVQSGLFVLLQGMLHNPDKHRYLVL